MGKIFLITNVMYIYILLPTYSVNNNLLVISSMNIHTPML
jgi:hypothetical protein